MLLNIKHISKQFNGIYALDDVSLNIKKGEIHGLVGENGAGKSTLIKILTGVYSLDEGDILVNNKTVQIKTPQDGRNLGIDVIHQDRTLISYFDGVENAFLGRKYPRKGLFIDWKHMKQQVLSVAEKLDIMIDYDKIASELSPEDKTGLEIVRAMMNDCKLLILDEPTAALTDKEAKKLFEIIAILKSRGTAILYVTHRLDEIFRLTDRITVLKNGCKVATINTSDIDKDGLVSMMADEYKKSNIEHCNNFGKILLEASGIKTTDGRVIDGNLTARSGEILGIFGLGGSGRTELLEAVFGYRKMDSGTVKVDDIIVYKRTPSESIKHGMVLISEDRRGKALVTGLSIADNIMLSSMDAYAKLGIRNIKAEDKAIDEEVEKLNIKMIGKNQRTMELSGGNQQKVVFAKAMMTNPKVFLCDEPTQAVDIMTRADIHRLLRNKADEGCAVIYVSSDLTEIMEVADTVQVMVRGCTKDTIENKDLKAEEVLKLCYA